MNDILTIEEIERRYPDEWVLLDEVETSDVQEVLRGRVLWHSKDQLEVHRRLRELSPTDWALLFTGAIPEDAEYLL
jgi:hypothetical protein